MNSEVKTILGDNIIIKGESIPIAHLTYTGKSKRFITWTLLDEVPSLSANDEPLFSVCPVDIDIFSDGNYLDMIKEIKKKMKNSDWVWTGDSAEMHEEDTGLYHKTCTFEKERILEWQE